MSDAGLFSGRAVCLTPVVPLDPVAWSWPDSADHTRPLCWICLTLTHTADDGPHPLGWPAMTLIALLSWWWRTLTQTGRQPQRGALANARRAVERDRRIAAERDPGAIASAQAMAQAAGHPSALPHRTWQHTEPLDEAIYESLIAAGMLDDDVLPPGLTPRAAGANLLPWKGSVGRVGDALARPLVEVT